MTTPGIIFIIVAAIFYIAAYIESLDPKNFDLPKGLALFATILLTFGILCLIQIY